jgi:CRP/FNR family transcriptional regulator, cyclic AMP receptor protein
MEAQDIQWPCELHETTKRLLLHSAQIRLVESDDFLLMGKGIENGLFYLIRGIAVIGNISLSKSCPFTIFRTGEWFGGLSVFKEPEFLFRITSINPSRILFIPYKAVRAAAETNPEVYKFLYMMTADHARETIQILFASSGMPLTQKVAYFLLEVSRRFPQVAGAKPMISMSQTTLAQMLGLSRITLNQQLHLLEKRNIICTERRTVHILDVPALIALASGENPHQNDLSASSLT